MGPRRSESIPQDELFRNRLENLIDQRHELVRLAGLIDWEVFDRQWGSLFSERRGAPAIATRLIAGLHYLKHLYKLSDEEVVCRWVENPYWRVPRTLAGLPAVSW
jgi:IS5 family transposase